MERIQLSYPVPRPAYSILKSVLLISVLIPDSKKETGQYEKNGYLNRRPSKIIEVAEKDTSKSKASQSLKRFTLSAFRRACLISNS